MNENRSDQTSPGSRVALEFESFRQFVEEYSSRISEQGIFIATESPSAVGSAVEFRISLSDAFRLLQGTGEVAWTVAEGEAPGLPAGMALCLRDVDDSSRRLIQRLVENHRNSGGEVFELERGEAPRPEAAPARPIFDQTTYEAVDFLIDGPAAGPDAAPPTEPPVEDLFETSSEGAQETDLLGRPAMPRPDEPLFETVPEADELPAPELPGPELPAPDLPAPELPTPEPPSPEAPSLEVPDSFAEPEPAGPPSAREGEEVSAFELPDDGEELLTVPDLPVEEEEPVAAAPAEAPAPELPPVAEPTPPVTEPVVEPPPPEPPALEPPAAAPIGLDLEREAPLSFEESEEAAEAVPLAGAAGVASGRRRLGFLIGGLALVALLAFGYLQRDALRSLLGGAAPEPGGEAAPEMAEPVRELPEGVAEPAAPPGASEAGEMAEEAPQPAPVAEEPFEPAEPEPAVFSGVDQILWREIDGQTMLILRADGPIAPERYEVVQLGGGSPRAVIKLTGVQRPFDRSIVAVGTGQIEQMRIGFHTLEGGAELHFVADLAGPAVRVVSSEVVGPELRVLFSGSS